MQQVWNRLVRVGSLYNTQREAIKVYTNMRYIRHKHLLIGWLADELGSCYLIVALTCPKCGNFDKFKHLGICISEIQSLVQITLLGNERGVGQDAWSAPKRAHFWVLFRQICQNLQVIALWSIMRRQVNLRNSVGYTMKQRCIPFTIKKLELATALL